MNVSVTTLFAVGLAYVSYWTQINNIVSSHLQVNESDGDDQYFGEYGLDFMAGKRKNHRPKHPFSGGSSCCSSA